MKGGGPCEIVTTRGGILAVRDQASGEIMHPVPGEAEALYGAPSRLAARLRDAEERDLVLLDVGLGAASNALTAWRVSEARESTLRRLRLVSFDWSDAALAMALRPENAPSFGLDGAAGEAARSLLESGHVETSRTAWNFVRDPLPGALSALAPNMADIVFWDPYSPKTNPALWTVATFVALRRVCRSGATVHTFSASTKVRSALLLAGFAVGVGPGTGLKEGTTMAAVDVADLAEPLDARWLARLERSSSPWPEDAPPDAMDRVRAAAQFTGA